MPRSNKKKTGVVIINELASHCRLFTSLPDNQTMSVYWVDYVHLVTLYDGILNVGYYLPIGLFFHLLKNKENNQHSNFTLP